MYWLYSFFIYLVSYILFLIDYFCLFNEKFLIENGIYVGKIVDIIKKYFILVSCMIFCVCVLLF